MADEPPVIVDCQDAVPPSGIAALLASVRNAGGERVDPVGWHYLDSLAKRAATQQGSVRHMLEAKFELATAALSGRLNQARSAAEALVIAASNQHPHAADELQQLFADSDFRGLRRLFAGLDARKQCAELGELVTRLEPALAGAPVNTPEQAAVRISEATSPSLELNTVRQSRASWARMSVDKQLAMAMNQAPQNAGPINSHMLVLRSLAMMRDISPDYLGRMVPYIDALLSLDPGEAETHVTKKKASTAKAGKPARAVKK